MNYPKDELVDMIFVLGECDRNPLLASRIYRQKYPLRRHPCSRAFENLKSRFIATGSVNYSGPTRIPRVLTEENENNILTAIVEDPHISSRQLSKTYDVSWTSVKRILKKNHFHDFHIQRYQELLPRDYEARSNFCQWAMQQNPNFFPNVLWSDEATFHSNGFVNRHNFHFYSDVNPRHFREVNRQNRWSLNVWGGIFGDRVIGPFFIDGNLNADKYLDFLQTDLEDLLEDVPLGPRRRMWLQHDGAPAHSSATVRQWLDDNFRGRWIGRQGPVLWPARSPDLTPLDFFLWGHVKEVVYSTAPTTPDDMKTRIRNCFRAITPDMLRRVQGSFTNRIALCMQNFGGHFEQLLL